jgi:hypothetical protein
MAKSVQARAAAEIKNKLKAAGFNPSVSSFAAAGCNGVRVYLSEADIAQRDKIEEIAMPYQYGHFNGMEDIYEFNSIIDSIPQVMFVSVNYVG